MSKQTKKKSIYNVGLSIQYFYLYHCEQAKIITLRMSDGQLQQKKM